MLSSGSVTYVAKAELKDSDWKRGAAVLEKEGKIAAVAAPPMVAGGGAAGVAASLRMFRSSNNLDLEISHRLLEVSEANGARYPH